MLDIDYRAVWSIGKGEFTAWFVPAGLLTNLVYARRNLRLSWTKSVAADLVMTAASWLVTVALPVWLLLWTGVQEILLHKAEHINAMPWSWLPVLLAGTAISTGSQILLLRCFRHTASISRFAILTVLNTLSILLASYRTWTYVMAHPPLA